MEETSLLNFVQSKAKVRAPCARAGEGRSWGLGCQPVQTEPDWEGKVCQGLEKQRRMDLKGWQKAMGLQLRQGLLHQMYERERCDSVCKNFNSVSMWAHWQLSMVKSKTWKYLLSVGVGKGLLWTYKLWAEAQGHADECYSPLTFSWTGAAQMS